MKIRQALKLLGATKHNPYGEGYSCLNKSKQQTAERRRRQYRKNWINSRINWQSLSVSSFCRTIPTFPMFMDNTGSMGNVAGSMGNVVDKMLLDLDSYNLRLSILKCDK